jgi:hypothetical protein
MRAMRGGEAFRCTARRALGTSGNRSKPLAANMSGPCADTSTYPQQYRTSRVTAR